MGCLERQRTVQCLKTLESLKANFMIETDVKVGENDDSTEQKDRLDKVVRGLEI